MADSREEQWLREASAALAKEEADQLEQSVTRTENRQAEEAYRHHKKRALALIRRNTGKKQSRFSRFLPVAAAAAVLIGGAWLAFRSAPPDPVTTTEPPSVSVVPYYSPEPTATVEPTAVPTPEPTAIPTVIPTATPEPTAMPTAVPTANPTATPTPIPTSEPTDAPASRIPADWTGSYFPSLLPEDVSASQVSRGEGWRSVTYAQGDGQWTFIEYDDTDMIPIPEDAKTSYVPLGDNVALRIEEDDAVTLAWVREGHSFALRYTGVDGVQIAESVEKISGE